MNRHNTRRRVAIATLVAAAAVSVTPPAQASAAADCDVRLDRLEAQFQQMADQHGYEAATEWWQHRWRAYWQSCLRP